MTAPTRTRRQQAAGTARQRARAATVTKEAPGTTRTARRRTTGTPQKRSTAAERAYARRAQRAEEMRRTAVAEPEQARARFALRRLRPKSKASFVLVMMGLLVAGVAVTLWLSTQAIADSYRLEQLRQDNAGLAENAERLQREVTQQESASSLAAKAKALGMVPGGDPARIVVNPDGSTKVVGEPKKATVAPAPPPPAPPAQPSGNPPETRPIEGDVSQQGDEPPPADGQQQQAQQPAPEQGGQ
ncbi:hypothetical protein [Amycolatopsis anabasis]|uniref:hypothetical protein n=1 Tax=Amycolatopsis anabasis TaxID=1840409 RepID=UPI00131C8326|nr:hypothetical protein [Amycolatopsis anabasis]